MPISEYFRRRNANLVNNQVPAILEPPVIQKEQKAESSTDACPKCGKIVKQGKYMHIKHCKGL